MSKLSIKQLIIIFVIGAIFLGGVQFYQRLQVMDLSQEEVLEEMVESGRITEEEKAYFLENGFVGCGHRDFAIGHKVFLKGNYR